MGSSSNVNGTSSPREKYPYPTEYFNVLDFVSKLSSDGNYQNWKKLMKDFIDRRGLIGFIKDAAEEESNRDDYMAWKRSDNLVHGWILETLSEETRARVLPFKMLPFKTARKMWKELKRIFDVTRSVLPEQALQKAAINGNWNKAMAIIEHDPDAVRCPITFYLETALHLSITSSSLGRDRFVRELLDKMTPQDVKDLVDLRGCTALHYAAEVDNREGAKLLVGKNPDLPNVGVNKSGDTTDRDHYAAEVGNKGGAKKKVSRNVDLPNVLARKSAGSAEVDYKGGGGAKLLVSRNSDDPPNVLVGKSGDTPDDLHYAADVDHEEGEKTRLVSKSLDVPNAIEVKYGDTPLHYAARYGHTNMVRYLMSVTRVEDMVDDKGASLLLVLTQVVGLPRLIYGVSNGFEAYVMTMFHFSSGWYFDGLFT
ncbi:hypothetical protein C3L33_02333, partial [Rhododendron williamsianum]